MENYCAEKQQLIIGIDFVENASQKEKRKSNKLVRKHEDVDLLRPDVGLTLGEISLYGFLNQIKKSN